MSGQKPNMPTALPACLYSATNKYKVYLYDRVVIIYIVDGCYKSRIVLSCNAPLCSQTVKIRA